MFNGLGNNTTRRRRRFRLSLQQLEPRLLLTLDFPVNDPGLVWQPPDGISYGTPLDETILNATASVPGSFVFDPPSNTLLPAGRHTLSVTFTPLDSVNVRSSTATTTIDVAQVEPTVTWETPNAIVFGTRLTGTQLNVTSDVAGSFEFSHPVGTILPAGEGQVLTAEFTPLDTVNFTSVTATVLIDVDKGDPGIDWQQPDTISFGQPLEARHLDASADVDGTFVYNPPIDTWLAAGENQPLRVTFTPDDPDNFESAAATVHIDVDKADPLISWQEPDPIVFGMPLDESHLSASAAVPGTFVYTPPIGTVVDAGIGQTLQARFIPHDTNNYNVVTSTINIDVARATPIVTWRPDARIAAGTPLDSAQLNATANIPGQFHYNPPAGSVLNADEREFVTLIFVPEASHNFEAVSRSHEIDVVDVGFTLTESDGSTQVSESGTSDTISVVLNDRPSSVVTLHLSAGDDAEISVRPDTLSFNSNTWSTAQRVTIVGLADLQDDGDREVELMVTVDAESTLDPIFDDLADQTVTVTNTDLGIESFELTVSPSRIRVRDGQSGTIVFQSILDTSAPTPFQTDQRDDTIVIRDLAVADAVSVHSGAGDDTIVLNDLTFASIDAGSGIDRLRFDFVDQQVDLSNVVGRVEQFEQIAVAPQTTLLVDFDDVAAFAPASVLSVDQDAGASVVITGNPIVEQPQLRGQRIVHTASQGEAVVEIINATAWSNPFDPFDVNRSGQVTSLDALAIINDLNRNSARELTLPDSVDGIPSLYLDTNLDEQLSARDALAVINEIDRRSRSSDLQATLNSPAAASNVRGRINPSAPADALVIETSDRPLGLAASIESDAAIIALARDTDTSAANDDRAEDSALLQLLGDETSLL